MELLLGSARVHLDAGQAERLRALLRHDLDWACLERMASYHGLGSLLYRHLQNLDPGAVPPTVLGRFRAQAHRRAGHNLLLVWELLAVLQTFARAGVPAIPYKGPALAALAYGNLAYREFSDLDILVREPDVPKAKALLLLRGYQPEGEAGRTSEAAYLHYGRSLPLVRVQEEIYLELQWTLFPQSLCIPLELDPLWGRLESVSLVGQEVRTFRAEDMLLILCAHGLQHVWGSLKWICDVAELVRRHATLDWSYVLGRADAYSCRRLLLLGLLLAGDLLGTPCPAGVERRIRADPVVQSLAAQVRQGLLQTPGREPGDCARGLFYLRARERLRDRVECGLRLVLTPRPWDCTALTLPSTLLFLYYLLRPLQLAGKYGQRLLRGLLGSGP